MDRNTAILIGSLTSVVALQSVVLVQQHLKLKRAHIAFGKMENLIEFFANKLDEVGAPMTDADDQYLDTL